MLSRLTLFPDLLSHTVLDSIPSTRLRAWPLFHPIPPGTLMRTPMCSARGSVLTETSDRISGARWKGRRRRRNNRSSKRFSDVEKKKKTPPPYVWKVFQTQTWKVLTSLSLKIVFGMRCQGHSQVEKVWRMRFIWIYVGAVIISYKYLGTRRFPEMMSQAVSPVTTVLSFQ